jgi:BirA family transcriptional regulator, biotin operon repressor / biotin---[acetyl-CoA-carboxylase] ligase
MPLWERFYPDRVIGARVLAFSVVDSTMDVARALAGVGVAHGTVVRADVQRTGRGRFARRWESAAGDSLLTSVVLRMPPLEAEAPLSVVGSLAVRDTVAEILGIECGIKWPNDVQVNGKKIAGVLVESQVATDGTGVAVMGIGFNVNLAPETFEGIADTATSLATEAGTPVDLDHVEDVLFHNLNMLLPRVSLGVAPVLARWRAHLVTLGQQIAVRTRDGVVEGEAIDVDEGGALLVRTASGLTHRMVEGDVTLRK